MSLEKIGKRISLQTVERMSLYRKVLEDLHRKGVANVYSHQLAEMVHVSPAQLRRDLASFGSFGNISKGYPVYQMILTISRLFGTDTLQNVALIGVGNLGRALLFYRGFEERGFHIAVVFDIDVEKVGPGLCRPAMPSHPGTRGGPARLRHHHGDPGLRTAEPGGSRRSPRERPGSVRFSTSCPSRSMS